MVSPNIKIKIRQHRIGTTPKPGVFDVYYNEKHIGQVQRRPWIAEGYWGAWGIGPTSVGYETKRDAVTELVERHERQTAKHKELEKQLGLEPLSLL